MRGKPRTLDKTMLDEGSEERGDELGIWRKRDFEIFVAPALSQRLSITSNHRLDPSSNLPMCQ